MLDRTAFLNLIDQLYARRTANDKAGVNALLAPGATYRIGADPKLVPMMPVGPTDAREAIGGLIDSVEFHHIEHLAAVVEGDKAAIIWRVELSPTGGDKVTTQLYDLWTVGEDGKITSLIQFGDTALMATLLGYAATPPRRCILQRVHRFSSAATRSSIMASVWNGVGVNLSRSVPRGTVG